MALGSPFETLPCDSGQVSRRPSLRMIAAGVVGVALLAVGIALRPQEFPIGLVLITVGALVLLLGAALSWVTQINLGLPLLAQVTIAMDARQRDLQRRVEDLRGMLTEGLFLLCPDSDTAERVLATCASMTMVNWHGSTDDALKRYVACLVVDQARAASLRNPSPTDTTDPVLRLPRAQREVVMLRRFARLSDEDAAAILGIAPSEVRRMFDEASAQVARDGS